MKDLIVLCASVLLGIMIFGMIAGDDNSSIKGSLKQVWVKEQQTRSYEAI